MYLNYRIEFEIDPLRLPYVQTWSKGVNPKVFCHPWNLNHYFHKQTSVSSSVRVSVDTSQKINFVLSTKHTELGTDDTV